MSVWKPYGNNKFAVIMNAQSTSSTSPLSPGVTYVSCTYRTESICCNGNRIDIDIDRLLNPDGITMEEAIAKGKKKLKKK